MAEWPGDAEMAPGGAAVRSVAGDTGLADPWQARHAATRRLCPAGRLHGRRGGFAIPSGGGTGRGTHGPGGGQRPAAALAAPIARSA